MGIVVNKNNQDDELTRRINADLRGNTMVAQDEDAATTDFVEDSEYTKNLQKTGRFSWIWVVLILLAAASLAFIAFF